MSYEDDFAPTMAAARPDASEEIPIIDLAAYLAGSPGAAQEAASRLRHALTKVGFYYVVGHGISIDLVERLYRRCERFFALDRDSKMSLHMGEHFTGYLPINATVTNHSKILKGNKPNLVESFRVGKDLSPEHPSVVSGSRPAIVNRFPPQDAVPDFREVATGYFAAVEGLARSLVPLYAFALDLAPDWFDRAFAEPKAGLRLSHYPQQQTGDNDQFGLAPHTDTSFMTLLPFNKVDGLEIQLPTGRWVKAPSLPGAFLINSGDMLRRWTNDEFLSTPHRVINASGQERYAAPLFFDCNADHLIECAPTCQSLSHPAKYEPITCGEYIAWWKRVNRYDDAVLQNAAQVGADRASTA